MKTVLCPVHGPIELSDEAVRIIDTPTFQRLRRLKQLGNVHYVYPGATHTRFAHSIGVYHLTKQVMMRLAPDDPQLGETVALAGLCHDVGHGPFSHLYEEVRPGFQHEQRSCELLHTLFTDGNTVRVMTAVIRGDGPDWWCSLVHNAENGLDVDKIDYLMRDAYYCGKPLTFEPQRILNGMRVVGGRLAFPHKDAYIIYQLFAMRHSMFRQVYMHRVARAIDRMVRDAIQLAVQAGMPLGCTDTDEAVWERMRAYPVPRALLERIERRQLYREDRDGNVEDRVTFRLSSVRGKNPLSYMWFYTKQKPDEAVRIDNPYSVSGVIPTYDGSDEVVRRYNRWS